MGARRRNNANAPRRYASKLQMSIAACRDPQDRRTCHFGRSRINSDCWLDRLAMSFDSLSFDDQSFDAVPAAEQPGVKYAYRPTGTYELSANKLGRPRFSYARLRAKLGLPSS